MPSEKYPNRRALYDEREFHFGSVWKVDDREVTIPQVDRTDQRSFHDERWVVVISNSSENYHPLCPIVTVAPLSHRVDLKKKHDLELFKGRDNVKMDCLLQLKLKQPILKKDLYDYNGQIHEDTKDELLVMIEDYYGLSEE